MKKQKSATMKLDKGILEFLQKAKDGEYSKIESSSLPYSRIKVQREYFLPECDYYYGIR